MLEELTNCTRCPLRTNCNQVVGGYGQAGAKLMILGEYPGSEEDLIGEPFAGLEGVHLEKLLASAGFTPDDYYKTLAVKCFSKSQPPAASIQACKDWLWQELTLVKPKIVLTLGKTPTKLLLKLKSSEKLEDHIGRVYTVWYADFLVAPWYNHVRLLRQGKDADALSVNFFTALKDSLSRHQE